MSAIALGMVCVILTVSVVLLLQYDDPLRIAARNSDTITIVATYDRESRTLTANQVVEYRNRSTHEKNTIKFHIFANAFREGALFPPVSDGEIATAFPDGRSFGHINVTRVAVSGAQSIPNIIGDDANVLAVMLPQPLLPNQTTRIEIDYVVQLANIAHRLGYTDRVVNLGNFYPVPVIFDEGTWMTNTYSYNGDPFFNALHNFNVTLTKPSKYIMASSGVVIREQTTDTTRTTTVRSYAIRDWAASLSPHFETLTRIVDRVAVNYYFLDDVDPLRSLETSIRSLRTFSRLFVRYPYKQLSVVQTDFLHGGMEFGEIVFISTQITEREEIDRVIIHEIAHQWWYGIIGNDQVRTAWIDEGLAEFSTLLFYDENPDFGINRTDYINTFRNNFATFARLVHGVGGTLNTNMNRELHAFSNQYEYVFMTYVRGMLLFVDLEKVIGHNAMRASLRHLAQEHKFGILTPDCVVRGFEQTTDLRLSLFFHSFTNGLTN